MMTMNMINRMWVAGDDYSHNKTDCCDYFLMILIHDDDTDKIMKLIKKVKIIKMLQLKSFNILLLKKAMKVAIALKKVVVKVMKTHQPPRKE